MPIHHNNRILESPRDRRSRPIKTFGTKLAELTLLTLMLSVVMGCRPGEAVKSGETSDSPPFAGRTIEIFVGSASKPATEEAARVFEQRTGAKIVLHFGGSGQMLAQIKLAGRGDLYFPGSSDYMELAKREGLAIGESERRVVYLVPAINVPRGNPKNIHSLADLARSDVRVGIARPDAVCVGLYAVEVLTQAGLDQQVRPRIVTQAESCEKTAQLVALGSVDAVIGWRVFHYWDPEKIETIPLPPEQVCRIGYIPIARTPYVRDEELAEAFMDFLVSEPGKEVFRRWHYLTSIEEARGHALAETPLGGEWSLPEGW